MYLRDKLHVDEDVILSLPVGLHHIRPDTDCIIIDHATHGVIIDHATALGPQLHEGIVVPDCSVLTSFIKLALALSLAVSS
jgi:hypothetical protein